jgi:hypothetical protein
MSAERYAYHATSEAAWAEIQRYGLLPQPQRDAAEQRCIPADEPAVYFCPRPEWATCWGSIVVRFPWPVDAAEDDFADTVWTEDGPTRTNWLSRLPVPPAAIERLPQRPARPAAGRCPFG